MKFIYLGIMAIIMAILLIGIAAFNTDWSNTDWSVMQEQTREIHERAAAKRAEMLGTNTEDNTFPLTVKTAIRRHENSLETYSKFGNAICFRDYVNGYYGCRYKDEIYYINDI